MIPSAFVKYIQLKAAETSGNWIVMAQIFAVNPVRKEVIPRAIILLFQVIRLGVLL